MTSCKKKDKDNYLTVGEAKAAFLAADEAMAALEADLAAEPAIKIIDKMLDKINFAKNKQYPHLSAPYYQQFFAFWHSQDLTDAYGYDLADIPQDKNDLYYDYTSKGSGFNIVYVPYDDKDTATVQWTEKTTTDKMFGCKASIYYPADKTPAILSTITCTLNSEDYGDGDINFTFNSTASGGKTFAITYNVTKSDGVTVGAITAGAGSYARWFKVFRNMSEQVYGLHDVHGQVALGLFGMDKQELKWANIKVYIDATTKVTKDTKIEIYNIEDKERLIGTLDAVSGIITYKDGGNTGQATTDMPLLYAHLKEVFNL